MILIHFWLKCQLKDWTGQTLLTFWWILSFSMVFKPLLIIIDPFWSNQWIFDQIQMFYNTVKMDSTQIGLVKIKLLQRFRLGWQIRIKEWIKRRFESNLDQNFRPGQFNSLSLVKWQLLKNLTIHRMFLWFFFVFQNL